MTLAMTIATKLRPAATSAMERANVPTTCGCCGREGLKKTVKMTDGAACYWLGTGCAAKAMGVGIREYTAAANDVQDAADKAERESAELARRAEYAVFQAWLDGVTDPSLKGDRFRQLQAIGGMKVARERYAAATQA